MDVLADALTSTGFEGVLLNQVRSGGSDWGCALDQSDTAGFHLIAEGACWIRVASRPLIQLVSGDVLLLPRDTAHELLGNIEAQAQPYRELESAIRASVRV